MDGKSVSRGERWGRVAARKVKWIGKQFKHIDANFVDKASKFNLPKWIAHIPIILVSTFFLALLAYGIILSLYLLISLLIFFAYLFLPQDSEGISIGSTYRDGPEGYGLYDSSDELTGVRIDK